MLIFGGVGVGWNTARLHFDFEPSLTLIRRPLALSPTTIAFHAMVCTFAFRIVTPGTEEDEEDSNEEFDRTTLVYKRMRAKYGRV